MLDDLEELQERWGFDGVSFYDANFGVHMGRVHEFASGVIERDLKFNWFAYMQADSVLRADAETLDLAAESGFYSALLGAESGSEDMHKRINKPTRDGGDLEAALRLSERKVHSLMTYIAGYPEEAIEEMWQTLEEAA